MKHFVSVTSPDPTAGEGSDPDPPRLRVAATSAVTQLLSGSEQIRVPAFPPATDLAGGTPASLFQHLIFQKRTRKSRGKMTWLNLRSHQEAEMGSGACKGAGGA